MKASYTNNIRYLNFTGKLPPLQRFIKGETDVNNVYESLQIQNLSFKNTGKGDAKALMSIQGALE